MNSSSIISRIRALLLVALVCSGCAGCYLLGSAQGEFSLLSHRVPLKHVIDDPGTSAAVRRQLEAVERIRQYAVTDLGLPDNGSYRSYADVHREYVVWNVVATPEFSVEARQWCYPIVGCVAYRGYFDEAHARAFASRLERGGYDVDVSGVAAYSTLGHFDDPVLSTMLGWDDVELAAIIFHELTHQMIYIASDADFDEALAMTVEEEGVRRWLTAQGRQQEFARYEVEQRRYREVVGLLEHTREQLRALYAEPITDMRKRERKEVAFTELRASYRTLTATWQDKGPFDTWFEGPLNNAGLAAIATYFRCVPGFKRELAAVNGDLPAFYRRVRELAALDAKTRDARLCEAPATAMRGVDPPRP